MIIPVFETHNLNPNALILFKFSGTLTVEQIYQDRDKFAALVREVASPDVGRMGIEILSFTIKVCRKKKIKQKVEA